MSDKKIIMLYLSAFYRVGTPIKIRDKMKSSGKVFMIRPLTLFGMVFIPNTLFCKEILTICRNKSEYDFYLLDIFLMAISKSKITYLQIKAVQNMALSNEYEHPVGIN